MRGTPPHRRLIDRKRQTARRHRGQHADIAGPGDAVEIAVPAGHPRHRGIAAEPAERPVERPQQPQRPALFPGQRRAGPLIGGIEQPDARVIELGGELGQFRHIRRPRPRQPMPRGAVEQRHQAASPDAERSRDRRRARRGLPARSAAHERAGRRSGYRRREYRSASGGLLRDHGQQHMRWMFTVVIDLMQHRFARANMVRHIFGIGGAGDAGRQIEAGDVEADAVAFAEHVRSRHDFDLIFLDRSGGDRLCRFPGQRVPRPIGL